MRAIWNLPATRWSSTTAGLRSYLYGLQELSVSKGQTVEKGQVVGALGEELTMDFKLGSRSVNPRLLFQTSGGLFWKENG